MKTRNSKKSDAVLLPYAAYAAAIDGLKSQGLDQADAVATLRVGLREANGRPVPPALREEPAVVTAAEHS